MWNDKYFSYLRALFLEGALKKSATTWKWASLSFLLKNKVKTASRIFFEGDKNWDCVRSSSLKMRNRKKSFLPLIFRKHVYVTSFHSLSLTGLNK